MGGPLINYRAIRRAATLSLLVAIALIGSVVGGSSGIRADSPYDIGPWEAETGMLTAPMETISDDGAGHGAFIVQTSSSGTGSAEYIVDIEQAGTYQLKGKVQTDDSNGDSLQIQWDGVTSFAWDVGSPHTSWTWVMGPAIALGQGEHRLVVMNDEPNVRIDRLELRLRAVATTPVPTASPTTTPQPTATPDPTAASGPTVTTTPTNTPAPTSTPGPNLQPVPIGSPWDAEGGIITAPMQLGTDDDASRGIFIVQTSSSGAGSAEYIVDIQQAGTYQIKGKVQTDDSNGDSLKVQWDGNGSAVWDIGNPYSSWTWVNGPKADLGVGQHRLLVLHGEPDVRIDKLELRLRAIATAPVPTPSPTTVPQPTTTPQPTATPDQTATPDPTVTSTPTNTPGPTNTPAPISTPDPNLQPVPIGSPWEAGSGSLIAPMQRISDNSAGHDAFIVQATTAGAGSAEYLVEIHQAGTYQIKGKVQTDDSNGDSLKVQWNSDSPAVWDVGSPHSSWTWVNGPKADLGVGQHRLLVLHGEPDVRIDKLELRLRAIATNPVPTPDPTITPKPTTTPGPTGTPTPPPTSTPLPSPPNGGYKILSERAIKADGPGGQNTYSIIRGVLGSSSVEAPDAHGDHQSFGPHIRQVNGGPAGGSGAYFTFFIHPDDEDKGGGSRSRNEIKADGNSPDEVYAQEGDIIRFHWYMRLAKNYDMSDESDNDHILHQLHATGGGVQAPIVKLQARDDELQYTHDPDNDGGDDILDSPSIGPLLGQWLEIEEFVLFEDDDDGRLKITIRDESGQIVLQADENNIDMWHGDLIRPKWGIYRRHGDDADYNNSEDHVDFADMTIQKIDQIP